MNHDLTQALETIETERINAVNDVLDAMSNLNHKYEQLMNTEVDITEEWFQQYALFYDLQNDLVSVFNESDIDEIVKSYEDIDEQCIMESTNETRPGLLKRLLEAIKNFFKKIGERISKIINWIKGSKLPKKTIDQICSEVIKSKSVITEAVDDSLHIDFPAMPGSVIHSVTINVVHKNLITKIKNGVVELSPIGTSGSIGSSNIANTDIAKSSIMLFIAFIQNTHEFRTKILYIMNNLKFENDSLYSDNICDNYIEDIRKIYNQYSDGNYMVDNEDVQLKINDLIIMTKYISNLCSKFTNINTTSINANTIDALKIKIIAKCLERLTYGCNIAANNINDIYMCDRKYVNTIKTIDELSEFVQACIDSGIPYKYIAYNTWVVMSNEFDNRNYWKKSDVNPRWGQSRVVFYPKNSKTVVLKIAMNSYGIHCNKREFEIYDKYSNVNVSEKYLVTPLQCTQNYCIMIMDRYNVSKKVDSSDFRKFVESLNNTYREHKMLPRITDVHIGNVGYSEDNQLKLVDYAGM